MTKLEAITSKKIVKLYDDDKPLGFICGQIDKVEPIDGYKGWFVVVNNTIISNIYIACLTADIIVIDGKVEFSKE